MLTEKLDMVFRFPSIHFPSMRMPSFPKLSAKDFQKDFAGGQATMTTSTYHCVNGVCDGKVKSFPCSLFSGISGLNEKMISLSVINFGRRLLALSHPPCTRSRSRKASLSICFGQTLRPHLVHSVF